MRIHAIRKRLLRQASFVLRWGTLSALLIMAGFGLRAIITAPSTSPNGNVQTPAWTEAVQQDSRTLTTVDTLLSQSKSGETQSFAVLNGSVVKEFSEATNQWLLLNGTDNSWKAVVFDDAEIWYLEATETSDGKYRIKGHWASYADSSGTQLSGGTLHGSADTFSSKAMLRANLTFLSEESGASWSYFVVAERSTPPTTDTAFLYALEATDFLQPLLYDELLPRNLPWADAVESLLPAVQGARTLVPLYDSTREEVLRGEKSGYDTNTSTRVPGSLLGRGGLDAPLLTVRAYSDGLAITCTGAMGIDTPFVVQMGLLRRFHIPTAASTAWVATLTSSGSRRLLKLKNGQHRDTTFNWEAEISRSPSEIKITWWIPYDALDAAQPPLRGDAWRLNCQILTQSEGVEKLRYAWGFPALEMLYHGAILEFTANTAPQLSRELNK